MISKTNNKYKIIPLILLFLTSLLLLVGCGEPIPTDIIIEGNNKRIEVLQGEKLDLETLSFFSLFETGLKEKINTNEFIVTGFNSNIEFTSNEPVLQQVTLTYKGISVKLDVYIVPKQISSITVFSSEAKTRYLIGEPFSINNILMYLIYEDGSNASKLLTKENVVNYDELPLDDEGHFTISGNFQLRIKYFDVEASNTVNILVEKHAQNEEEVTVVSNTTLVDSTKEYGDELPNLSRIEITPLLNGVYKIIKTSEYSTENVRAIPYQDSPVFTDLEVNEEYIIIAHQKETDFYKAGKTYELFVKTEPLATPEPEIVSYGYNYIEIRKVNNYINYSLDYNYRVVDLGETIKLTNLEPNVKYEITAKYIFNAEKDQIEEAKISKTLLQIDNPYIYEENQVHVYNNTYFDFELELQDEFKGSGNIATQITYNNSTDKPINVGVYEVIVIHRFSPTPLRVGTLKILPRAVDVVIDNLSKEYHDDDPTFTISTSSELAKDHDVNNAFTVNLTRQVGEVPGEYKISGNITNSNYTINVTSGSLTITKKNVQARVLDVTKSYGSNLPTPQYSFVGVEPEFYSGHDSVFVPTYVYKDANIATNALYPAGYYEGQITLSLKNPYYEIEILNKGNILINQLEIDLRIHPVTKVYGDDDPKFTYTLSNENFRDALNVELYRESGQNVGEYLIKAGRFNRANFILNITHFDKLTITPRNITVKIDNIIITYGQTYLEKLNYTLFSGNLAYGDTINDFAINHNEITNLVVGNYPLKSTIVNSNYNITVLDGNLKISKKDLIITPILGQNKTYGQVDPNFRYDISGLISGDEVVVSLSRQEGQDVGTYSYILNIIEGNDNYNFVLRSGVFTIKPKSLEIVPTVLSKTYLDNNPELKYNAIGLVHESDLDKATGSLARAVGENVGSYDIFVNNLKIPNYTLTMKPTKFVINPKPILINYNLNESYVYGSFVALNNATAALKTGDYIVLSGYNQNVGTYTITPSIKNSLGQDVTSNYSIEADNASFTVNITKADLLVRPNALSKTYDSVDPVLTYQVTGELKYNDNSSVVSGTLSRVAGEDVGNYGFIGTGLSASNYNIVLEENNKFTINPKEVTVNYTTTYTYTTETISINVLSEELVGNLTYTTTPSNMVNVGTYSVKFTSTNPNYVINNSANAVINVEKKLITLQVLDATKAKGANNPQFFLDETPIQAFIDEVDFSNLLIVSAATSESTYGEYDITVAQGLMAANYRFEYLPGILTVKHADFSLDIQKNYVYNGQPQELIVRVINNDNVDITDQFGEGGIVINYQGEVVPVNAGIYPVSVVIHTTEGDVPFDVHPQVISPKPITITYNIPSNFTYGQEFPTNPATSLGLVGNHCIDLVGNIEGAGIKTVTARILNSSNEDVSDNYKIENGTGIHMFEIKKAVLTVTPDLVAMTKTYGSSDPELTFTLSGFVNDENESVVSGALTRSEGEDASTYLFKVDELVAANYRFVISENAKLFTISKLETTVDYKLNETYTYGDEINFAPLASALLPGHVISLAGYNRNVGYHVITPVIKDANNIDVTSNYNFTNGSTIITISPATLTITPINNTVVYGSGSNEMEFVVSGYKYDDNNLVSGALSREAGMTAGAYRINLNTLASKSINYVVSLGNYNYNILPKEIEVSFDQPNYIYNGKVHDVALLSDDLVYDDVITITNNNFINASTYDLTIKILNGENDVTNCYTINPLSLKYVISPREITDVSWSYNNLIATATSDDLVLGDSFTYQNNNRLEPGKYTATLNVNSNYIINDQSLKTSYEYTHYGTIEEVITPQEVVYDKGLHKYDVTYLKNKGYTVGELINPYGENAQQYTVRLRLEKEYYYPLVVETTLTITKKQVNAQYLYNASYVFNNQSYLNDNLVVLPEGLTLLDDYTVHTYKMINGVKTKVYDINGAGSYIVEVVMANQNYAITNNSFDLEVMPANLNIILGNELLFEGDQHPTPNYETSLALNLVITYQNTYNESSQILGITNGTREVNITKITFEGIDYTNNFNFAPVVVDYTIIAKDYIELLDYNKDDLNRDEDNMFANGLMEATKNPAIGFGYRYQGAYYVNRFVNGTLNPDFNNFSNTEYYYKYGMKNTAKIYIDGLVDFTNINFDNVVILGQGVTLLGVTYIDLTSNEIHASARRNVPALEVQFSTPGTQTITIAYQKFDQTLELAKLNIEVKSGFTNITKYEELFKGTATVQNIILNNGIAYLQTLGITIKVNAGSTLYGNNYEINSYSAAYADDAKPQISGVALMETSGTIDNVRIIQRKTTSYASTSQNRSNINSDINVVFEGGFIKNSFIAYGRETVEIRSTTSDVVIENSTILSGPFGIRRRSGGKLTLINTKIVSKTDLDFLRRMAIEAVDPSKTVDEKFKVNGIGIPLVFLNNSGLSIKALDIENITVELLGDTKIYSFHTIDAYKGATLPAGVSDVVVGNDYQNGIIQELWEKYSSQLVYFRPTGDPENPFDTVLSPGVLFVSPTDITADLETIKPVVNFAETFLSEYKDISLAAGYGYVFTYNHVDENEDGTEKYSPDYIQANNLFNPPNYIDFTGEYEE